MRYLPSIASEQYGCEPYHVIKVQWVADGPITSYSDRVLSLGPIENVINVTGNDSSQSVPVSLDDVSGELRAMFDTADIHQRPAWIYLCFNGSATETLLFKGEVSSPIVWREGSREVKFTIISKIEEAEVGFSAEQAEFTTVPESVIGEAWPLSFGTVCKVKTLKLSEKVTGTTLDPFGIPDPSLPVKIGMKLNPHYYAPASEALIVIPWASASEAEDYCGEAQQLSVEHLKQYQYAVGQIRVNGGEKFPQSQMLTVKINDKNFRGYFSGQVFHFENGIDSTANYANYLVYGNVTDGELDYPGLGNVVCGSGCAGECTPSGYGSYHVPRHPDGEPTYWAVYDDRVQFGVALGDGAVPDTGKVRDPLKEWDSIDYFTWPDVVRASRTGYVEQRGYFLAEAGSSVELVLENEPVDYVINLIGATDIKVCANYSTPGNSDALVGIPYDWYTIISLPIGPYDATILRLKQPLSVYDSKFSDDDIYVSFTSEIGNNAVDVMEWLISTYSHLNWDLATFDEVKSQIDCYGVGFTITEKRSLLDLLRDIAYQSRCALWLKDGVYFLKYISAEPDSTDTLDWSDIHVDTFELGFSSTESLTTRLTALWGDCGDLDQKKIVLRNNIAKYGLKPSEYYYYIYNDFACVLKSATFHLLRQSNTFKQFSFTCSLNKLTVEPFDAITVNGTLCIVETVTYDPAAYTVSITCWVPIRAGESSQYELAFPATVAPTLAFGTNPPTEGTALNAGYGGQARATNDTGDQFPSDTDDVCCDGPDTPDCTPYVMTTSTESEQQTATDGSVSFAEDKGPGGTGVGVTTSSGNCLDETEDSSLDQFIEFAESNPFCSIIETGDDIWGFDCSDSPTWTPNPDCQGNKGGISWDGETVTRT